MTRSVAIEYSRRINARAHLYRLNRTVMLYSGRYGRLDQSEIVRRHARDMGRLGT